jgi:phospholipase/carboxylesterase
VSPLAFRERPPAGEAQGLLVLNHGRGADELDLLGLADVLDPRRLLLVVTPRAPLTLPGMPGYHWYAVPRVGHPDPAGFAASVEALGELHDALWERTGLGPDRTILGGFSQGTVMSYALGLHADRPAPAGILALSGFIPTVVGWEPSLEDRTAMRVFIAHGRRDPLIGVEFAREARELLSGAGLEVDYRESDGAHEIDAAEADAAAGWIAKTLGA